SPPHHEAVTAPSPPPAPGPVPGPGPVPPRLPGGTRHAAIPPPPPRRPAGPPPACTLALPAAPGPPHHGTGHWPPSSCAPATPHTDQEEAQRVRSPSRP